MKILRNKKISIKVSAYLKKPKFKLEEGFSIIKRSQPAVKQNEIISCLFLQIEIMAVQIYNSLNDLMDFL